MNSSSVSGSEWTLTEESFTRFLAHLDLDRDRAGEKYESLRMTLMKFFDWRGAHFPEDCADETFNRVARKIDSGEAIRDIMTYCHGVARLIFLETLKHPDTRKVSLDELTEIGAPGSELAEPNLQRQCFEQCLSELPPESSHLILEYYKEEKRDKIDNRASLAERLSIPLNALRSRAQRVRGKLESCVARCTKRGFQ